MAIAIDNAQYAIAFATTVTYTGFTVTGSNMIGIVSCASQANAGGGWATDTSGVNFNGSAMTKIDVVQINSGYGNSVSLWGRLAPTTGNVVATRTTNTDRLTICIATYSGVSQSTAIGSLTKTSLGTSSGTSFTGTLTAGTNSWVALGTYISAGGGPGTAGSGTTLRVEDGEVNYLFDSNGAVSGSTSLNVNCGGSYAYGYVMVAFDPEPVKTADYLVIAGGGGSGGPSNGTWAGGGGAGGYQKLTGQTITAGTYTVTVGAGGTAGGNNVAGGQGGTSSFNGTSSTGGGGSAGNNGGVGGDGGSGAGGNGIPSAAGGTGTVGQGNAGGAGSSGFAGGGGGGASAVGGTASGTTGANGGAGTADSITGSSITRAGGGGGSGSGTAGTGGSGGGGNGNAAGFGSNGTSNTGGGAGGPGAAGGSGVVIVRLLTSDWTSISGGTQTTDGSFTVVTFNSSGSLILSSGAATTPRRLMLLGIGS